MDVRIVSRVPEASPHPHPLLFVHGAWHGAWCWEEGFLQWFAERGWECHALDLRHHGESEGSRSLRRSRIRHYVEDLAEAIDSLDRPPVLVAHSMGTLISQRHLETRDLPGAVLLAPIPIGGVWRATFRTMARHPLKFLEANLRMNLEPLVDSPRMARSLLHDPDVDDADVERVQDRLQAESYTAYLDMLFVTRARPQLVHTPVAIVAGDQDRLFSVREFERLAAAYGGEPTIIPGAAHDLMLGPRWRQTAEATLAAIERF